MALPINVESLLNGRAVESNQLEYKEGWNLDAIYRSICAFANDFEDTGGGYIIVGVKEEHGRAVRPVLGVEPEYQTYRLSTSSTTQSGFQAAVAVPSLNTLCFFLILPNGVSSTLRILCDSK